MANVGRLRLKLLALLLLFALVPVVAIELISIMEMNQASKDVQEKVSGLSGTLNRSALTAASNEADQVQIAVAKAGQYNEFFSRIRSETQIIAEYASESQNNQSCDFQGGIWIAPFGANETLKEKMKPTMSSLCIPAKMLQSVVESEPDCSLGYIATEDGAFVTWPNFNDELSGKAPYDPRKTPWYISANSSGKTVWTKPFTDSRGSLSVTCATPIRRGNLPFGVVGMNISLASLYSDLSSKGGRGYPFIADDSGAIIMRSSATPRGELSHLFDSENFFESNSSEIRELIRNMLHGETGSIVVGLGRSDGYVAYAPITTPGWSFGIAYPVEEMSLPARFIDSGIKDTAKGVSQGLTDAAGATRQSGIIIVLLTIVVAGALGFWISRRIENQAKNIAMAADKIRNGDLDIPDISSGDLGILGESILGISDSIKQYAAELDATAERRASIQKEVDVIEKIKRSIRSDDIPQPKGYEIVTLSIPSNVGGFDFYDVIDVGDDKIALYMAEVSEGGISSGILAVVSRVLIKSFSVNPDPSKVLSDVNIRINDCAAGSNLACFYAVIDTKSSTMEFVNAGFNPSFIMDSGGSVDTLGGGGIALGVLDRLDLHPERIPVQPGDVLMVYSDGVTEATNVWRTQQGAERLITVLKDNRSLSASEILGAIEKEMRLHMRDHPPKDDIMLVILKKL